MRTRESRPRLTLDPSERTHLLKQPNADILALAPDTDEQVAEEDGLRVGREVVGAAVDEEGLGGEERGE